MFHYKNGFEKTNLFIYLFILENYLFILENTVGLKKQFIMSWKCKTQKSF